MLLNLCMDQWLKTILPGIVWSHLNCGKLLIISILEN